MMKLIRRLADVRAARARVVLARTRAAPPLRAIGHQLEAHPLACLSVAAGGGWALHRYGAYGLRLLRVRAFVRLVSMQVWPWVVRLMNIAHSPV